MASEQPQMPIGDCRTQGRDDVAVPVLVRHGGVHVPLDDHHLALAGHRLACQIESEQRLLFVE